jgi:hypothetical protein
MRRMASSIQQRKLFLVDVPSWPFANYSSGMHEVPSLPNEIGWHGYPVLSEVNAGTDGQFVGQPPSLLRYIQELVEVPPEQVVKLFTAFAGGKFLYILAEQVRHDQKQGLHKGSCDKTR